VTKLLLGHPLCSTWWFWSPIVLPLWPLFLYLSLIPPILNWLPYLPPYFWGFLCSIISISLYLLVKCFHGPT
jgi:hypothetical protein